MLLLSNATLNVRIRYARGRRMQAETLRWKFRPNRWR